MTVEELIERLENEDPSAEVRLQTQENYPLQSTVRGVWVIDPGDIECRNCDQLERDHPQGSDDICNQYEPSSDGQNTGVVYIVEGSQVRETPYGNAAAFEQAS